MDFKYTISMILAIDEYHGTSQLELCFCSQHPARVTDGAGSDWLIFQEKSISQWLLQSHNSNA
jgi:hypothetical protein